MIQLTSDTLSIEYQREAGSSSSPGVASRSAVAGLAAVGNIGAIGTDSSVEGEQVVRCDINIKGFHLQVTHPAKAPRATPDHVIGFLLPAVFVEFRSLPSFCPADRTDILHSTGHWPGCGRPSRLLSSTSLSFACKGVLQYMPLVWVST